MNLNEGHIDLLKQVRERMYIDAERNENCLRPYICWNIFFVHKSLRNLPRGLVFEAQVERDANDDIKQLIAAVDGAINKRGTFCNWLDDELHGANVRPNLERAYALGRLAWLDKMIETRVIA